jgi:hypothetical protein
MKIAELQNSICSILKPEMLNLGFTSDEYSPHFCSIHFSESNLQMIKHITLQFFNDSLGINSLRGFIALNKVNSILEKFIDLKVNKEYCTLNNIEKQEIILTDIKKLNEFSKQNNISQYSLEILNHINEINLPYFDKYPDIQSINEKVLNQVPENDYPEWIHGQSTLKILIIMKLCDNPKYESYKASKEKEYLFFVNQNPSMWKPAYDTFLSLVKYLG